MPETFWTLLRDPAHWAFEIFLMMLFDGLLAGIFYPMLRSCWRTWSFSRELGKRGAATVALTHSNYVDGSATTFAAPTPHIGECAQCEGPKVLLDSSVEMCKDCGHVTIPEYTDFNGFQGISTRGQQRLKSEYEEDK